MRSITGPSSLKDSRVRYDRWIEERRELGEEERRRGGEEEVEHTGKWRKAANAMKDEQSGDGGRVPVECCLESRGRKQRRRKRENIFPFRPKPLTHTLQSFTLSHPPISVSISLPPSLPPSPSPPLSISLFPSFSLCV